MTIRVCVSVLPRNLPEALSLVGRAEQAQPDFIEVRLDCLDVDSDLATLVSDRKIPLIATDKSVRPEVEHRAILITAANSGFEFVDLDLSAPKLKDLVREIKSSGAKCIVSYHDFEGTPNYQELNQVFCQQIANGADVCKIVATANKVEDNLTLLKFTSDVSASAKIVCFAMGEAGRISRLLSPIFGGFFTFASLGHANTTAPGQMTLLEMQTSYQLLGLK